MINELYIAHLAMRQSGISAQSWHRHLKSLPKYPTFFLMIDETGNVVDIDPVDNDRRLKMRKWETANGESFPTFNVPRLFQPVNADDKKLVADFKKTHKQSGTIDLSVLHTLMALIPERFNSNWSLNQDKKLIKCLAEKPKELNALVGDPPAELWSLKEIGCRSVEITVNNLHDRLWKLGHDKIWNNPNNSIFWIDNLVIGSGNIALALELANSGDTPYPVNHPKVFEWINEKLVGALPLEPDTTEAVVRDAFNCPYTETDPKFPDMKLDVLGNIKLRSMFGEIPCQFRYGQAEANSYPLHISNRQNLKTTMEWLADPKRKGRTWQNISTATDYKAAILIAYPVELAEVPPQIAAIFGGLAEHDVSARLRFEDLASHVVEALDGIVTQRPQALVQVFVLAKADNARSKLLAKAEFTVQWLTESTQRWQDGASNLPEFDEGLRPMTPFPTEVVSLLKTKWIRGGETSTTVKGARVADGITLMVGHSDEEKAVVNQALHLTLDGCGPLLKRVGHWNHRGDNNIKISKAAFASTKKTLGLIGILLKKKNTVKGDYMHEAPFLVGRILKLADLIHREYCIHNRDSHLPPQLVGNALVQAALDNPQTGMARLFERLRVYLAWATTAHGENIGLTKWILKQLEYSSAELSRIELPTRCDDAGKAQMMLGYLALLTNDKKES